MKRLFIAVKVNPGDELLKLISSLKTSLSGEKIKWVDLKNIHLTLAFLGDTEEKKIPLLNNVLESKCKGICNFEFTLSGTGVFRNFRDPRVIWAGISSPERLIFLNRSISEGLSSIGLITGERNFSPHLTLGRIKELKERENLKTVLEEHNRLFIQIVPVSEVILFESILKQTGPLYLQMGKYLLQ